ncbi:MAG: hypothetical protein IJG00_00580 [Clostridia bacterium]|nr:hypothetical protein [Clostridia bacterium]
MNRNCCKQNSRCFLKNLPTNIFCRNTFKGQIKNGNFIPAEQESTCSCRG